MTVLEARVAYSEFPWVFLKSWLLLTLLECAISLFMEVQIQHSTENKNRGCNDDPALHTLLSQALRHFKSNQRHLRWRCNAVSLTAPPPHYPQWGTSGGHLQEIKRTMSKWMF